MSNALHHDFMTGMVSLSNRDFQLHYNLLGPLSHRPSIIDRRIVMMCMTVLLWRIYISGHFPAFPILFLSPEILFRVSVLLQKENLETIHASLETCDCVSAHQGI